ncbi:glycine-rich domain-containing protein [Paracoccus cavernae]|uniref:glycine-rich domain-containing protein n=1 Tax=Paracoccus cavernae TaxID=1571207 RepID=UPI003640B10B
MWHGGAELERLWAGGREWVRPAVVTVTGGVVTIFDRGGVSFTQVLFRRSGSIHVSAPVADAHWALVGGGGSGGYTGRSTGGGGAAWPDVSSGTMLQGDYLVEVGAGGAGLATTGQGNPGSPSRLLLDGVVQSVSPGGGSGSGNGNGGAGGNGGGAGTNGNPRVGGIGNPGNRGGNSVSGGEAGVGAVSEGGGGGGGAGGAGVDGLPKIGGAGGAGITLGWCEPAMDICGGGGGGSAYDQGTATHGGSGAARGVASSPAVNGGGSGGSNQGSGNGGEGLFVLVFPSANAKVVVIT